MDKIIQSSRDTFLQDLTTSSATTISKGKHLIILYYIGSGKVFVPGGLLSFESKKKYKGLWWNEQQYFFWLDERSVAVTKGELCNSYG